MWQWKKWETMMAPWHGYEQAVEQTIDTRMTSDAMIPMQRHCNGATTDTRYLCLVTPSRRSGISCLVFLQKAHYQPWIFNDSNCFTAVNKDHKYKYKGKCIRISGKGYGLIVGCGKRQRVSIDIMGKYLTFQMRFVQAISDKFVSVSFYRSL